MANFNRTTLMGPVYNIKPGETTSGKSMVFFTVATFKRQGEDKADKPQFHNVVAYGAMADVIINHVTEKRTLYVEGNLDYYTDKDGVQRTQIVLEKFEFTDSNPNKVA